MFKFWCERGIILSLVYFSIGEPVEITVEIKVVSFGELNEANMVLKMLHLFVWCEALNYLLSTVFHGKSRGIALYSMQ